MKISKIQVNIFLRRGIKSTPHSIRFFYMQKSLLSANKDTLNAKFIILFAKFLLIYYYMSLLV
jgi:hypothetical protein